LWSAFTSGHGVVAACKLRRIGKKYIFKKDNNKPTRLMSQVIKYRNRDKGVSLKLGNPMTENHGLDIDRK
jgi:hypothetical protein